MGARSVYIDLIEPIQETTIEAKKQKKEERAISWEKKKMHCQFFRQTKEVGVKIGGSDYKMGP